MRFVALVLTAIPLIEAAYAQTLEEAIRIIRRNTAAFTATVPDFVATEKMTSTEFIAGKPGRHNSAVSEFTCARDPRSRRGFLESREVTEQDGRPVHRNQLRGPSIFDGGFSNLVASTFSERNAQYQQFRLDGETTFEGRTAISISFQTVPGQQGMRFGRDGKFYVTEDSGRAWVEPGTMRVLRLERTFRGLPSHGVATMRITYAEAPIEGAGYWLPKSVEGIAMETKRGKEVKGVFTAEYTNYRKFGASSSIRYDDAQ